MIGSQKRYFTGVAFFILSLFISSLNDVIAKYMGINLPIAEVVFFRFFFSTLLLLPFMSYYGLQSFATKIPIIHFLRSVVLFLAMTLWTLGLTQSNVVIATIVSFTIPFFTMILAIVFLKERVGIPKWLATILGFVGIILVLDVEGLGEIKLTDLGLLLAAICFASLDIINKKYIVTESMLSMLFYSSLFTILLALPQTIANWINPTFYQIVYLIMLGAGANLLLYLILEAFKRVNASSLAPFRYIELMISSSLAYSFFKEIPSWSTLQGAIFIIPSSLFLIHIDAAKERKVKY